MKKINRILSYFSILALGFFLGYLFILMTEDADSIDFQEKVNEINLLMTTIDPETPDQYLMAEVGLSMSEALLCCLYAQQNFPPAAPKIAHHTQACLSAHLISFAVMSQDSTLDEGFRELTESLFGLYCTVTYNALNHKEWP